MSLPTVAIVGRPNVGKSSLLNALVGRKIAIVDPTAGVTRDRISAPVAVGEPVVEPDGTFRQGGFVELVDTGGIGIVDSDHLSEHVEEQIGYAIAAAALVLFVVDGREGICALDKEVARRLRKIKTPVILVVNKIDHENKVDEALPFVALGFGEPMPFSAKHSIGRSELLEAIHQRLGKQLADRSPQSVMKLAIVGKRNAGKSTFINALAGEQRVIVSETPGTTRDSVDVTIQLYGKTFTVIDTAGVRKRKSFSGDIEFYSHHRAMRSIRRADVVALMIDASVPISQVDKELAGEIAAEYKPVVLVVNKWDLAKGKTAGEDYQEYFDKVFPELTFAPVSLVTATEGTNVKQTIRLAEDLYNQSITRVPTAELNAALEGVLKVRGPSHKTGTKPPRLYYASQISTQPPTIVCFVNDARSFDNSYQRFLINHLRTHLPFAEVPIRLLFRGKPKQVEKPWISETQKH
jgi:GTP-binding protein